MRTITVILLFISLCGYSQIDEIYRCPMPSYDGKKMVYPQGSCRWYTKYDTTLTDYNGIKGVIKTVIVNRCNDVKITSGGAIDNNIVRTLNLKSGNSLYFEPKVRIIKL